MGGLGSDDIYTSSPGLAVGRMVAAELNMQARDARVAMAMRWLNIYHRIANRRVHESATSAKTDRWHRRCGLESLTQL